MDRLLESRYPIIKLYLDGIITIKECADKLNLTVKGCKKYLTRKRITKYKDRDYTNKDWLYNQYIVLDRSMDEIAVICGISNKSVISKWVKKFEIKKENYTTAPYKWDIQSISKEFDKYGYIVLSKGYINKKKLKLKCEKGHEFYMLRDHFMQGHRCPICSGKQKHSQEYVERYFNKYHFTVFSEYKRCDKPLRVKCPKDHKFEITFHSFQKGRRCLQCYYDNRDYNGNLNPNWQDYSDIDLQNKNNYHTVVRSYSEINYNSYKNFINPLGKKRSKEYHLDHIYSIIDGFINKIDPRIVASPINLRVILAKDNLVKSRCSEFSKEELIHLYCEFKRNI